MANRNFTPNGVGLEKKIVDIYVTVDFNDASAPAMKKFTTPLTGGAGAYATTTTAFRGCTSVARTAQGKYTFTFDDSYVRLLGVDCLFKAIDLVTSPKALAWFVLSETIAASTKTVVVGFTATANSTTLVDLGANDRVVFDFTFADSTAP